MQAYNFLKSSLQCLKASHDILIFLQRRKFGIQIFTSWNMNSYKINDQTSCTVFSEEINALCHKMKPFNEWFGKLKLCSEFYSICSDRRYSWKYNRANGTLLELNSSLSSNLACLQNILAGCVLLLLFM